MNRLGTDDLVLCSGTVRRAPLDVTVRAAAAAGAQGVSAYFDEYVAALAAGWDEAGLRALFGEQRIAVAELDGAMRWLPGDTAGPPAEEFVAAAVAVGARSLTVIEVSGRDVGGACSFAEVAAAFGAVCDLAAPHGLLVHLEYFPFSGIADLATAYEVVRRAGRPNGGILLDTWHHLRGRDAGRLDPGIPGDVITGVQVSDVLPQPLPDVVDETLHHRMVPGEGMGRLPVLLRSLRDQGCTAPMEVEVYSAELAALDPEVAARRCLQGLRAVLAESAVTRR
jgi:sugar phosphate isomerase/epimerase